MQTPSPSSAAPPRVRALRNGLWNVARIAVSLPIFLLFTRFLYETLGDTTRGAWALVGALWLQPALFDLGVGEALTRAVAGRRRHGREEVRRAAVAGLTLLLGVTATLVIVYLGARDWLVALVTAAEGSLARDDVTLACDLTAVACGFSLLGWGAMKANQGLERYDASSAQQLVTLASFALAGVWLVHRTPRLSALGEAAALAAGVGLALGALQFRMLLAREPAAVPPGVPPDVPAAVPPRSPLREMLGFAPVLYLSSLSGLVEGVVDKFLLGTLGGAGTPGGRGTIAAGYLDNATEVAGRLRTLPVLLAAPIYPAAAAASDEELGDLYRGAARLNVLAATPLLVGGFAFATPFVHLWLGSDGGGTAARVAGTAFALSLLCVGMFLQVLYVPAYHLCNGRGRPWPGTIASLVSAAVNLALALWLVRDHGLRGVAIAIVCGHAVACVGFLTWFHRREGLSIGRTIFEELHPPLACMITAAGLCLLALRALPLSWGTFLACTSGSVALYGILLLAVGHVRPAAVQHGIAMVLRSEEAPGEEREEREAREGEDAEEGDSSQPEASGGD